MGTYGPGGEIPPEEALMLAGQLGATCAFVASLLTDEPTEHDLAVVREHTQACRACSVLYAEYYLRHTEATGGAA